MAISYVLVKRGKPGDSLAPKRWYAKSTTVKETSFDSLCAEVSHSSSATKGDVMLCLDGAIASMVRHLSEGEVVSLGEFGRFRMEVQNTKKTLNDEGIWVAAAPLSRDEFSRAQHICGCRIVFTPGSTLRDMCKTAKYNMATQGGTVE